MLSRPQGYKKVHAPLKAKLNFQLYTDYIYVPPQMNIFIAMNDIWIRLLIA